VKAFIGLGALGILLVVIILIGRDIAATPSPAKGACVLARRTILPDICVNSCKQSFDCTASTRPYAIFGTQAATCDDAVICQ
jgi:hypothetical protein